MEYLKEKSKKEKDMKELRNRKRRKLLLRKGKITAVEKW